MRPSLSNLMLDPAWTVNIEPEKYNGASEFWRRVEKRWWVRRGMTLAPITAS
jgi:hypothetical protein